ncbi:hypothetical protein MKW94_026146 [Papaver nudicaule]|uniref:Sulfotransferase n=1 Tax=Papaver nudicaule TaxID=74823 RepID=A0AA41UXY3_PAPNU|nr:hypothetical protein [Papaver nudicaule]
MSAISDETQEHIELLSSLPKGNGWGLADLCQYQGFWCASDRLGSIVTFQKEFKPLETDLILATLPKSGTIWLKSMVYATVNRVRFPPASEKHPLLTTSAHDLVPFLEYYLEYGTYNSFSDFNANFQSPKSRLFSTHVPYALLPESVKNATNSPKIVYLCRNPKDNFVSLWHFFNKRGSNITNPLPLEKVLELYCRGESWYGPLWDNMLGYWKASLETPSKVLFLKYEELKKEPKFHLKRLAEFLGCPFSLEEEENGGTIDEILRLSSFEFMKNLDVNKNGITPLKFRSNIYFRKGEVGDWKNHLTASMAERIDRVFEEKMHGSGLLFDA